MTFSATPFFYVCAERCAEMRAAPLSEEAVHDGADAHMRVILQIGEGVVHIDDGGLVRGIHLHPRAEEAAKRKAQ